MLKFLLYLILFFIILNFAFDAYHTYKFHTDDVRQRPLSSNHKYSC